MHFFGLHNKSLINLEIVSAIFGIGGAIASIPGYVPVYGRPPVSKSRLFLCEQWGLVIG